MSAASAGGWCPGLSAAYALVMARFCRCNDKRGWRCDQATKLRRRMAAEGVWRRAPGRDGRLAVVLWGRVEARLGLVQAGGFG